MKILFDHPNPFLLAHGGFQTQIEQTKLALEQNGVEVEWLRWWDASQTGQVIHYFGRPSHSYVRYAQQKGMRVVLGELLTGLGSRGSFTRRIQRLVIGALRHSFFFDRMGWEAYRLADAVVALTPWEAQLMREMFGAPAQRVHVIPNGVEEVFFRASTEIQKSSWLVCTATITQRKRVLELAQAAVRAGTPLWVIGKPYAESDEYYQNFRDLVGSNKSVLRYEGGISDRGVLARIYSEARGFALLSTMESLSLSALEAAACGTPLLLSDLPWARTTFGTHAQYAPVTTDSARIAQALRNFYDQAPLLPPPPKPLSWREVTQQLAEIYKALCGDAYSASSSR